MTQCQMILEHLEKYGSITPKEALDLYGIMRLGARIWDLKRAGMWISRAMISAPNRNGEMTRFAKYSLGVGKE